MMPWRKIRNAKNILRSELLPVGAFVLHAIREALTVTGKKINTADGHRYLLLRHDVVKLLCGKEYLFWSPVIRLSIKRWGGRLR